MFFKKAATFALAMAANQRVERGVTEHRMAICKKCNMVLRDAKGYFCGMCKCRVSSDRSKILNLASHVECLPKWGCKHERRVQGAGWPRAIWAYSDLPFFQYLFGAKGIPVDPCKPMCVGNKWVSEDLDHAKVGNKVFGASFGNVIPEDVTYVSVRGPLTRKFLQMPDLLIGDPLLLLPRVFNPEVEPVRRVAFFGKGNGVAHTIKGSAEEIITQIKESENLVTNRVEGAVLADAYGVPWTWDGPKDFPLEDYRASKPVNVTELWREFEVVCTRLLEAKKWQ